MNSSSTKSSQKLLHKFAPFRKRNLKQARSNNALAEDLPSVDEIATSLQSPGSVRNGTDQDVITSNIIVAEKWKPFEHRLGTDTYASTSF